MLAKSDLDVSFADALPFLTDEDFTDEAAVRRAMSIPAILSLLSE
jgi:hypothetical protein